jgi:transcriptional regulator with XRE-family HTH domain
VVNQIPLGPALGAVIRELRHSHGLTLATMAANANIHENYARGIEQGRFNPSLLIVGGIADALGVRISDLIIAAERRYEG